MNPFSVYSNISTPTFQDHEQFSAFSALEAQQLLQQIGWTYYTIWKEVHPLNIRLAWSRGDVNRSSSMTGGAQQSARACEMGLLLQKFYQHCSLLPLGVGIAGGAMASRQYQWASGNDLLQQINALSSCRHQPAPPALQAHGFQTIVCIPLQKNAAVLEIGTTELVPESKGVLSQVLKFTKTFGTQLRRTGLMTSPSLNIGGQYLGKPEEHMTPGYASNAMQMYQSRVTRQPSISSSYHSSSSPNSSSPSLEQTPQVTTTMLSLSPGHNSFTSNEEMLISPVSSRQAAPMSMVRSSFDQLDLLNEMGHIDTLYSRSSVSMPSLSLEIDSAQHDPGLCHFNQDHRHIFDGPTFSYGNVGALSLMPSFLTEYMPEQPISDHHITSADQRVFESAVIQPLQGAGHNAGNIIDLVQDASAGDLLASPAHEQFTLPGVISSDHNSRVAKGKQVVSDNIWVDGAEKSRSKWVTQMQQSTSIVNSLSARSLRDQDVSLYEMSCCDDGIKDRHESRLMMRAFRPWTSRMEKPKSTANRYNVKMIMRFHLPRISDMMNAEAGRTARYVFQMRTTLGAAEAHADYGTAPADSSNMNIKVNAAQRNEAAAAKQHMFAERNRRRKQGDCFGVLRTLVPNISKRDKVTTLERTIEYLKEMQSLVHDLQQQRNSFQNSNAKDIQNINQSADHSQNIDATLKRLTNSNPNSPRLLRNATCVFHQSARDKHVLPHFELDLHIKLRETLEANASLITIITGLQQRKLQCIDLKTEFHQSSNNLSAKILAQYKDEQNYSPTLEEIQDIKQWWTNHIDKFST